MTRWKQDREVLRRVALARPRMVLSRRRHPKTSAGRSRRPGARGTTAPMRSGRQGADAVAPLSACHAVDLADRLHHGQGLGLRPLVALAQVAEVIHHPAAPSLDFKIDFSPTVSMIINGLLKRRPIKSPQVASCQ